MFSANAISAETRPETSGYLPADIYAKLQPMKLASGREIQQWRSSKLNRTNYKGIMVDSVMFYPAPTPGPQISSSTLDNILAFSTKVVRQRVGEKLNLVDVAGPGVVRMQAVITAVKAEKEGLTALDVIPVHFLFSAAKSASGETDMNVTAMVETRLTDSMTGELLGAATSVLTGEQLKNSKQQIKLENVQQSIDTAATDGATLLDDIE
ncbi:MAG: DUF3313 domain-containing protein [Halioglobus sp.]